MKAKKWGLRALPVLIFVCVTASVYTAQKGIGVARDETVYMHHGTKYAEWWAGFFGGKDGIRSPEAITAHFGGPRATDGNREHPPLLKTLFGFSHRVLGRTGPLDEVSAYRLPSALFFGLFVVMVFAFTRRVWGLGPACMAALFAWFSPRLFFHAGLASFDAPVVTTWFAVVYCYFRSLDSRWWSIALGLAVGAALATKHNAIMLPAVLLPHYLIVAFLRSKDASRRGLGTLRNLWSINPWFVPSVFVLGPLTLLALWPWLWFDTGKHLLEWLRFHLTHVHYNFEYLGQNWNAPPYPWHVPLVTALATTPLVTWVAGALGVGALLRDASSGRSMTTAPSMLLFLSASVAIGPFLLTTTPIFGAEKHFAPIVATIAIFAGLGAWRAALVLAEVASTRLRMPRLRWGATCGLSLLVVSAALSETVSAVPYGLTHYSAVVGGPAGAADLGMNRQFWGYSARGALPFMNRFAPKSGKVLVYTHDAAPSWGIYARVGLLKKGLGNAGHERAGVRKSRIAIVVHEKHFNRHDYMIWDEYKTVEPAFVLSSGGVPIVSVYLRPGFAGAAEARPPTSRP